MNPLDFAEVWAEAFDSKNGVEVNFETPEDAKRYLAMLHRSKTKMRKLIAFGETAPCDWCVTRLRGAKVWVGVPKPKDFGITSSKRARK